MTTSDEAAPETHIFIFPKVSEERLDQLEGFLSETLETEVIAISGDSDTQFRCLEVQSDGSMSEVTRAFEGSQ